MRRDQLLLFCCSKTLLLTLLLDLTLSFLSCQRSTGNGKDDLDANGDPSVMFPDTSNDKFLQDLDSALSQSGTGLSESDKNALMTSAEDMQDVNPQMDPGLSQALKAEVQRILDAEKKGKDMAVQKMVLAGKILTDCATRVARLSPIPGEPLLGTWWGISCIVKDGETTTGGVPGFFTVSGGQSQITPTSGSSSSSGSSTPSPATQSGATASGGYGVTRYATSSATTAPSSSGSSSSSSSGGYKVGGMLQGQAGAKPDGSASIQGTDILSFKSWTGELSDKPHAGKGYLSNPQYYERDEGVYDSCTMGVTMESSKNPIPEKFIEGMRQLGSCYRKGLMLISPVFDDLFKGMDPKLAQLIKLKMLGLQ